MKEGFIMKKKVLSVLLVSAMAVSMFAGCGGNANGTTGNAGTESGGNVVSEEGKKEVTLKTVSMFGGTDPNAQVYQAINDELMAQYDYITIEDNSQSSDEEWKAAVNADFSVGNEPDVIQFFTDATADTIVATDKLVSIEEIRAEYPEYAKDTLDSALSAAANTDGVERAVPTTGYWEGLFCNKDLFDQYNLELPTDWDSLVTAIETFKENDIIPIACSLNNVPHYWIEFLMLYSSGVDEFTTIPTTAPAGIWKSRFSKRSLSPKDLVNFSASITTFPRRGPAGIEIWLSLSWIRFDSSARRASYFVMCSLCFA